VEDPKYIADIVKLFDDYRIPEKHSKTMVFKRFTEVPMTTYEEFIQDEQQRALLEDEYRELLADEQSIIANNVM
jgi:hypothetical protein